MIFVIQSGDHIGIVVIFLWIVLVNIDMVNLLLVFNGNADQNINWLFCKNVVAIVKLLDKLI